MTSINRSLSGCLGTNCGTGTLLLGKRGEGRGERGGGELTHERKGPNRSLVIKYVICCFGIHTQWNFYLAKKKNNFAFGNLQQSCTRCKHLTNQKDGIARTSDGRVRTQKSVHLFGLTHGWAGLVPYSEKLTLNSTLGCFPRTGYTPIASYPGHVGGGKSGLGTRLNTLVTINTTLPTLWTMISLPILPHSVRTCGYMTTT